MNQTASIDMLHGPLAGRLLFFALPIAASSMLQQLFNATDTAVVGRFADASALAAVGTNSEIVALLVSLSAGLAVGANVLLARQIGSGQGTQAVTVHTALALACAAGLALALPGLLVSRLLLLLIHTPAEILEQAVCYLRLYLAGVPAILLYDFGAAILRARGDSRRPFLILLLSGVLNLLLNLFFVLVCRLGVAGVALATGLANLFSAVFVLQLLAREGTLHARAFQLDRTLFRPMLRVGIPAALQGAVFCLANIFVQSAVNQFGAAVTAGSAIATNFEYFGYYMITAFGQAATTFASQNHAAGNTARCRRILLYCLAEALLCSCAVILPLVVFRARAAGAFSPDEAVIQAACLRISLILRFEPICCLYEVPAGYLRGLGFSALPAGLMVLGICCVRVVWVAAVFRAVHTLPCLYSAFPLSWCITTVLLWCGYFWCQRRLRRTAAKTCA